MDFTLTTQADSIYHGKLIRAGVPCWVCQHDHHSQQAAHECAHYEREGRRQHAAMRNRIDRGARLAEVAVLIGSGEARDLATRATTLADAAALYGKPVDQLTITQLAFADEWWKHPERVTATSPESYQPANGFESYAEHSLTHDTEGV